jgi:predicted nucleic acid-binding protein
MSDRIFVDSNVLVYAHDLDAGEKRNIAARVLRDLWASRNGTLSTQVLQEFYVNVTRKIPRPLPRATARRIVGAYGAWQVVGIDPAQIVRASEIEESQRLSFWDALIVVAASKGQAAKILSEDLTDGRRIEGVVIENPFRSATKHR